MKKTKSQTPTFPGFHIKTLSRKRRSGQQILREKREAFERNSFDHLGRMLQGYLDFESLTKTDTGEGSKDRVFSIRNTFFAFLGQCLSADGSCQEAVHRIREQAQAQGAAKPSASTSAYCQARKRLDEERLRHTFYHGVGAVEKLIYKCKSVRPIIAIDGTTFSMPDTKSNQQQWPQSAEQKPGIGFPMLKMVGAFSIRTGALIDVECGNKHDSEAVLLWRMRGSLTKGDILLIDRAFGSYVNLVSLAQAGIDSVARLHHVRKPATASDALKVYGPGDLLVEWKRPKSRPAHISQQDWEEIPRTSQIRQVTVRVEVPGYRSQEVVIATTLSPEEFSAQEVAEMFRQRWQAETSFRDLKCSLDCDLLRCKNPEMIRKELWMKLIAYNALCYLMTKAAKTESIERSKLSFKSCLDVVRVWTQRFRNRKQSWRKLLSHLLQNMAAVKLPSRQPRVEPRVNKRRPKTLRLMMETREALRAGLIKKYPGLKPLNRPLS